MMKKNAVVTGASRGIGSAIVKRLAGEGYEIVAVSRSGEIEDCLKKFQDSCAVRPFKCDISSDEDRKALLSFVEKTYGKVNLLVNNAGITSAVRRDILLEEPENFDRIMGVNLRGTFFLTQLFANFMIKTKKEKSFECRIINISSVSAYAASVERSAYCISKAGISMMTSLFADRLAAENIPVFEVRPGIIRTDMTSSAIEKYEERINNGLTPVKRTGSPDDVAKAVSCAASGLLDFGTGTVLNVDGGFSIRRL